MNNHLKKKAYRNTPAFVMLAWGFVSVLCGINFGGTLYIKGAFNGKGILFNGIGRVNFFFIHFI